MKLKIYNILTNFKNDKQPTLIFMFLSGNHIKTQPVWLNILRIYRK
jgi:hypothetical protein